MTLFDVMKTYGKRPAVISGNDTVSYYDLLIMISKSATLISALNRSKIIIKFSDSLEFIVAFLGCYYCNVQPVVVSNTADSSTIAHIIEQAGCDFILSHDNFKLQDLNNQVECSDMHLKSSRFFLCTSGTTGYIKLVEHKFSSILGTGLQFNNILKITSDFVLFSAAKMSHAFGMGNSISIPFSNGASVVIDSRTPTREVIDEILTSNNITMLCGIPRHFLSIPEGKFNFKYALLAGEQTPYSINQLLVSHNITPIDAIGTTETLGFYLTKYLYGIRYDDFVTVPGCELVLIPTEGDYEVKIRSEHSAIGYINNKFIDGFYHTGDLVSLHAGQMQFKGRRGDRVKINGLHYYLNDIDNQIKQCDGVIDCACTITQNKLGINKLTVNAIVADRQHIKNIKSLMSRKQIPYYINLVSSLPKTASGKVKRHAITSAC